MEELLGVLIDKGHAHQARIISDIFTEPECKSYLDKLILMDRNDRKGFDEESILVLFRLRELHTGLFDDRGHDIWDLK
jgi:hypothetical protein